MRRDKHSVTLSKLNGTTCIKIICQYSIKERPSLFLSELVDFHILLPGDFNRLFAKDDPLLWLGLFLRRRGWALTL